MALAPYDFAASEIAAVTDLVRSGGGALEACSLHPGQFRRSRHGWQDRDFMAHLAHGKSWHAERSMEVHRDILAQVMSVQNDQMMTFQKEIAAEVMKRSSLEARFIHLEKEQRQLKSDGADLQARRLALPQTKLDYLEAESQRQCALLETVTKRVDHIEADLKEQYSQLQAQMNHFRLETLQVAESLRQTSLQAKLSHVERAQQQLASRMEPLESRMRYTNGLVDLHIERLERLEADSQTGHRADNHQIEQRTAGTQKYSSLEARLALLERAQTEARVFVDLEAGSPQHAGSPQEQFQGLKAGLRVRSSSLQSQARRSTEAVPQLGGQLEVQRKSMEAQSKDESEDEDLDIKMRLYLVENRLEKIEADRDDMNEAFKKVESESNSKEADDANEDVDLSDFAAREAVFVDLSQDDEDRLVVMKAAPQSVETILKDMAIFQHLSQWEIGAIASSCQRIQFQLDDVVVKEGDPGEAFWVIESGWLQLMKSGQRIRELDPGSYFGKSALLSGKPSNATVKVGDDQATLWKLSKEDFSRFFNHPEMQPKIAMSMFALNSEDIGELRETVKGVLTAVAGDAGRNLAPRKDKKRRGTSSWDEHKQDQLLRDSGMKTSMRSSRGEVIGRERTRGGDEDSLSSASSLANQDQDVQDMFQLSRR